MPRPTYPPTPGSSTDIKARDGVLQLSSLHLSFELPPPALHHDASSTSCALPSSNPCSISNSSRHSSSTYTPSLPAMQVTKQRRRPLRGVKEETFSLPPPPTRSRKIIQMKPRAYEEAAAQSLSAKTGEGAKGAVGASRAVSGASSAGDKGGKKKPGNVTSAAGRKIARKTAHSLIERRRRSKMNEEFGVLKNMIPACTGEMHKLAILQASIEYIRYLEECVDKLKAQHTDSQSRHDTGTQHQLPSIRDFHPTLHDDVEMTDSDTASHLFIDQTDQHRQPLSSASPPQQRQPSPSSAGLSTTFKHYTYSASATTSPVFTANQSGGASYRVSHALAESVLPSPTMKPHGDLDQEATAALMMLNHSKRTNSSGGRGLSVRDLVTT
ncbi:hypothetical protein CDD82_2821 [Ophiocordyceps australis]|uniref:BHLH domain-containing protein n=1 Tax=Ophiocordyceps australis TaxID=1399860 RepID=A0A2C5ZGK1_9HYPO|nr:hypothetical protein CDD82_2821 [Ophiocordyceps australis]